MKKLLGVLALSAAVGLPASANAALQKLTDLFVFGDSLSDGGNSGLASQLATGGKVVYPPPPYFNGQYSNGKVAVQYLWEAYNGPNDTHFKPSLLPGGTNYAIGGATTGLQNYNSVKTDIPPALAQVYNQLGNAWQLNQFNSPSRAPFDPASSLFVIWLFPNDVFYAGVTGMLPGVVPGSPGGSNLIENGILNIITTIQTLAGAGAQHFLVPNMPDLGETPGFQGQAAMTGLSVLFNQELAKALTTLDQALPAEIVQFDTFAGLDNLVKNGAAYGFTNTTDACVVYTADPLAPPTVCANPNQYVFWDGVHPTTAAHKILGAEFAAAVPEPGSLFLLALGLFGLAGSYRRKSR